ncbi:MAG: LamG-like jellyroll fold domain-containing protein, partial [Bacteroidota bacterium]|nr:LamG-like jellyroll fold domain-containing protein [Bacteroidota bacterium]
IGVNDTLVGFKIYSQCAVEEYKLPLTIIPTSAIVNDSFCGNYVFNGKTYTQTGTFYDTSFNSNGCRVITQLNLTPSGSVELSNGLIRYWLGNGPNGNVSLLGNDTLTPFGNIQLTGWAGRAENANGAILNGLINNTYLKTNLPTMSTYSISFWYKMESNGANRQLNLLANGSTTAAGSIILVKTAGGMLHVLNSAGTPIGSGFNIIANVWNHITLIRNGSNFSLYVNGNLITSGTNINPVNPDQIGNNGVANNGNGAIGWYDDIKVYNRVISAPEAAAIYSMPSVLSTPTFSNFCQGYPGAMAFQFQRDSSASIQFLRNGNVVANDTFFNFTQILPTDTSIGYRIIKACATETVLLNYNNEPTNLNNGLIRYWPFNDAVNNRRDLQTNQTFGYLGNFDNSTGRTGLANAGLHISGVGKIVYSNTILPGGNISVSLWYQRVASSYSGSRTIIGNNQSNGNIAKYLWITNNGQLYCGTNTANSGANTNIILAQNQWYHFVYNINTNGEVKLYVNGVLTMNITGVPVHPITYFGNRPDGNEPGVGNYDDVRIYNRSLSLLEVQKLFGMPSILSIPHNVQACEGSSLNLSFSYGPAANKLYTFTKNGVVVGTDSSLRINAVSTSDTLFNFTLNTNCGQENHTIKVTVNPATGVGPTLNYSKITSRITANSSFTSYKLYRNGLVVDSSNTIGNINYLTNRCGTYIAEFRNTSTGGCPVVSPVLTITIDTVLVQANICSGKVYNFGNQQLSTAGTYFRTINSVLGCDSTIRLNLNVKQASSASLSRSGCGVISLFGKNYTQSGIYKDTLINSVGCDSIITLNLSIAPGNPTQFNLNTNACKQFTFRNKTYTSSGLYRDTIYGGNVAGCDSIIVLNLSIQNSNKNVSKTGNTLTALETGASYQWFNCQTQSIITNANSISYTPVLSGNYAVIISKNNCIDTSNCTQVTISNCNVSSTFTVFPQQDSIACKDGTINISNASLPISLNLSWTTNPTGLNKQISDSVTVYNQLCPETYLLRITDAVGCKDSIIFTINQPSVGLKEQEGFHFQMFPNPAQNSVNIIGLPLGSNIRLVDLHGKEILKQLVEQAEINIETNELANGVYVVWVENGNQVESRKLVINR